MKTPEETHAVTCKTCGGPVTTGHFYTACSKCQPFHFQRCGICNAIRIECCC